jgi:hypothetical protein
LRMKNEISCRNLLRSNVVGGMLRTEVRKKDLRGAAYRARQRGYLELFHNDAGPLRRCWWIKENCTVGRCRKRQFRNLKRKVVISFWSLYPALPGTNFWEPKSPRLISLANDTYPSHRRGLRKLAKPLSFPSRGA